MNSNYINISKAVGILTLIAMLFSGFMFIDDRHLHAEDFQKFQLQNMAIQLEMQLDVIEERIIRAEEENDSAEMRRLEDRKERLSKQLDIIIEQQIQQ